MTGLMPFLSVHPESWGAVDGAVSVVPGREDTEYPVLPRINTNILSSIFGILPYACYIFLISCLSLLINKNIYFIIFKIIYIILLFIYLVKQK